MISTPNNTDQKIEFNFTCYALKLLGQNLYSNPWTAVSEIVANGIDAKADCICVLVDLFDKENAQIEIIDNGYGMTYQDLCDKYTIIGRNKRIDSPNDKSILGRKGIGKLAALFLSDKYYLYTKTQQETSSWVVDVSNSKDDDIPALERYVGAENIAASELWKTNKTGTAIKLTNVNLKKIGKERLKALPVILSDYYLSDIIQCEIKVCVRHQLDDPIFFVPVSKNISFSTMYSIFDNTGNGYKERLNESVYLTSEDELPLELDKKVPTIKYDDFEGTSGVVTVKNLAEEEIDAKYQLTGWIGIHGSLDSETQRRNNPEFNKVSYHPNAIRLYVRGKLAVDNLLTYITNTQAFANYVEGEICFDILDDDRFEDISTSNREGYKKDDERVRVLLDIVGSIVQRLINNRVTMGSALNKQLREYNRKKEEEKEQQRIEAEKKAEAERLAKEKAEQEAALERERARQESETRKAAEEQRDSALAETEKANKRLFVLENNFTSEGENYKHAIHLSVNFAKEIRSLVCDFEDFELGQNSDIMETVMAIDLSAAKIENLPKFIDSATFSLSSPTITTDVIQLIKEYVEAKGSKRLEYSFDTPDTIIKEVEFTDILMFLENIISNSNKANATSLNIISKRIGDKLQIDFIDNGNGLADKYMSNPQVIFELGETTTPEGFGIGAFHMREIVKKMDGEIFAIPQSPRGLAIRMVI